MPYTSIYAGGNNPALGGKTNPFADDFKPGQYARKAQPIAQAKPQSQPKIQATPKQSPSLLNKIKTGAVSEAKKLPSQAKNVVVGIAKGVGQQAENAVKGTVIGLGGNAIISNQNKVSDETARVQKQADLLYKAGIMSRDKYLSVSRTAANVQGKVGQQAENVEKNDNPRKTLAGAANTAALLAIPEVKGASLLTKLGKGAAVGGALGAGNAAGQDKVTVKSVAENTAVGALLGAGGVAAEKGISKVLPEATSKVKTEAPKTETAAETPIKTVKTPETSERVVQSNAKSFAPLDAPTKAKVDTLVSKAKETPVPEGHTRLYQTTDNGARTDQYFKDTSKLSNYVNGRSDNATLAFKDVPTKNVVETPGKPDVFKVQSEEETKVSGGANKAESRAVEANLAQEFGDKANYETHSFKQNAEDAVNLVHENPEKAMDIAMGKVPGNNTVHEVAVAQALENKAIQEGDATTLAQLAKSSRHSATSEAAQRLGAEGFVADKASPVAAIRSVLASRAKAAEAKLGKPIATAVNDTVKQIKSTVPKTTRQDFESFVASLKC